MSRVGRYRNRTPLRSLFTREADGRRSGSTALTTAIGIVLPLKMLPLVLLEIFYKVLWLIVVAYLWWSTNHLIGSFVEKMTYVFLWVALPIIAIPWKYAFRNYILETV